MWAALGTSSAVFALCHASHTPLWDMPLMAGWGCVLGLLMLRTRNLAAPIAAHSFSNTVALVQQNLV